MATPIQVCPTFEAHRCHGKESAFENIIPSAKCNENKANSEVALAAKGEGKRSKLDVAKAEALDPILRS
jgi:hypothetical protein